MQHKKGRNKARVNSSEQMRGLFQKEGRDLEPEGILDLFFNRSERAVDACRAQYGAALRGLALRITGSARDAEECESDAYLAAW